ncbi:hypothetical protein DFH06DRAFT_1149542 [Mycena polygramma]|nr:hypothetical protein DFH06DRAFT_1149542 [Mycena polygramma]
MQALTWDNIHFVRQAISAMVPVSSLSFVSTTSPKTVAQGFARKQAAWLYPDGDQIGRRVWVRVPVVRGLTRAYWPDQLETDMWIDGGRGGSGPTTDVSQHCFLVDRFPFDEPQELDYAFWIVVADQRTWGPDVHELNTIVNRLVPGLAHPWRGNVLVFKRGKGGPGKPRPIVNISEEDGTFVEAILKRSFARFILTVTLNYLQGYPRWFGRQRPRPIPVVTRNRFQLCTLSVASNYINSSRRPSSSTMPPNTRAVARRGYVSATQRAISIRELYDAIFRLLTLIDLTRYRLLSSGHRLEVHEYFYQRVIYYTAPFFVRGADVERFFQAMDVLCSLIVGSIPLAVLSMPSWPPCPDNMNLIAAFTTRARWSDTMTRLLNFGIAEDSECAEPYGVVGYRFMRFTHPQIPGKTITITFANRPTIYELWFSAPNSCQWNAIGAHSLVCPAVEATSNLDAVMGYWNCSKVFSEQRDPVQGLQVQSPFPGIVTLHADTTHWDKPCGLLCPGLPRFTRGLKGVGHWSWGGITRSFDKKDRVVEQLGKTPFKWAIGDRCLNGNCPNGPNAQA